jgi:hypothetical protein
MFCFGVGLFVPGKIFNFGVGVFMSLVECFVLELASLCEYKDGKFKTKQLTRNIKMPTPKQNIQLAT